MSTDPTARRLWRSIEPIHAVTYFAEACREANRAVGLRGFWMGYFGSRSAPMGPVGPGVVAATFHGFHPDMVRRSIPDAWGFASPDAIIDARCASAAAVLRELHPDVDTFAARWGQVLASVAKGADGAGRPLFAANRDLPPRADPVEALWQACTTLREQRGDGHVAVLVAEGLDGCEAHVLAAAAKGIPDEVIREGRGWSTDDWRAARGRLAGRGRGLFDDAGVLTDDGMDRHRSIEQRTDELAGHPYDGLGHDELASLEAALAPLARAVATVIRFPNPMGLPAP